MVPVDRPGQLARLVGTVFPAVDRFLVKVNWSSCGPGSYTDPHVLDLILPQLPGERILIEGHSHGRCRGPVPRGAGRDWHRAEERAFLEESGLLDCMGRHGASYLNVSEEIWGGRTVPQQEMEDLVCRRFGALEMTEFYGYMPSRLFEGRERTLLLDLARIKHSRDGSEWSLVLKNMFGLIPDILRVGYHSRMPRAIVDIIKVYMSAFPVLGIAESLRWKVVYGEGPHSAGWTRYDLEDGGGFAAAGTDLVDLELSVARLLGLPIGDRTLIRLALRDIGR